MAHKFDPKNKGKLQSEERKENLPPEKILEKAGLGQGETLIDVGCGVGYFSIPGAKKVGAKGKVYALDTSSEMTAFLTSEIKKACIENIEVLKSQEYGFPVEDSQGDMLLMSMVLHEVEDKKRFLQEARRTLKNRGRILIIEWEKKETEQGPPLKHRLDFQETKHYLTEAGFKDPEVVRMQEVAETFYIVTARA
ncbi:class I SAM-dependent methyltransferase [Isachenkonia alkalipeptolytica]|uniref:Methyltransferase domain-containing protein n=1 Tax=Isachenkonia alkalipeptolytica TaxID=2565777 RepID=A0AA44BDD1_9CLOT|nr:class I SAM-dependent methyltransferase [Isachenkonia alkalipeptolytica]NBG86985.1 methyltransferase domain-containing protein [Isachenkonia alkalipeptolytica]